MNITTSILDNMKEGFIRAEDRIDFLLQQQRNGIIHNNNTENTPYYTVNIKK